jgi:hypothetical protein
MKLLFTNQIPQDSNGVCCITDLSLLDMMCDDAEAEDIVVDEYLRRFKYAEIGPVMQKIVSKLRIGGTITVVDRDIELMAYRLSKGDIDVDQFNDLLCSEGPINCFVTMDTIRDLLNSFGIHIQEQFINEQFLYSVTGRR